MLWGFFKKLVLADRAAVVVNQVFQNYTQYSGVTNIVAVLMYSIQLHMDFSGGMDVVMGVAALFGVELDQNFKRPYCNVHHRLLASLAHYAGDLDEGLYLLSSISV
ncbi:MAG: hypothetical protein ACLTM8_10860 [Veillonella parvula]